MNKYYIILFPFIIFSVHHIGCKLEKLLYKYNSCSFFAILIGIIWSMTHFIPIFVFLIFIIVCIKRIYKISSIIPNSFASSDVKYLFSCLSFILSKYSICILVCSITTLSTTFTNLSNSPISLLKEVTVESK